jgi:ligand-binding sensor domain-containing protein
MMKKFLPGLFFLISVMSFSQESRIKFKHITVDDGLAHNYITALQRDSYGYLWIGFGNSGLNKYDGCNFTHYRYNALDTNSLSNNTINLIYEGPEQNMWVCSQGGLDYYDRSTDQFIRIETGIQNIIGIHRFKDGNFFLCSNSAFYFFNYHTKVLEEIENGLSEGISDYYGGPFLVVSEKQILIPTARGLLEMDMKQRSFKQVLNNHSGYTDITAIHGRSLFQDSQGRIWMGTESHGLFLIELKNNQVVISRHFVNNPDNPHSISSGTIKAIQEDQAGNIWIANFFSGVVKKIKG